MECFMPHCVGWRLGEDIANGGPGLMIVLLLLFIAGVLSLFTHKDGS